MATGKRTGKRSQQQNDFLQPFAPTSVSATDVGTNRAFNDGAATVSFSLPANSPAATSYTVTATASGQTTRTATGASSPITVTGLASNVQYSITVTATNASGTSAASSAATVTATTVPATMSAPTATAGVNQDTVSWTAPSNGGKAITLYRWTSSDGKTGTTTSTSVTVTQEANTAQTYQVRAENANGVGVYSANSNSVTTQAPFFPPFFPFFPGFGPFFPPFFPFFPPSFFGQNPLCIHENTPILTPSGEVLAKNISIGDTVYAVDIEELPADDESFMYSWVSNTLTFTSGLVETTVTDVVQSVKTRVVYFNGLSDSKYSLEQPIFIKHNDLYQIVDSRNIEVGDYLIKLNQDGSYTEEEVTTIDIVEEDSTVYKFSCEPYDWFIAGGYLVHNK